MSALLSLYSVFSMILTIDVCLFFSMILTMDVCSIISMILTIYCIRLLYVVYDSENVNVWSFFSLIMKMYVFSILLYGSDNVCLLHFLYDSDNGSLTLYLHSFVLSDAFLLNVRTPDAFLM